MSNADWYARKMRDLSNNRTALPEINKPLPPTPIRTPAPVGDRDVPRAMPVTYDPKQAESTRQVDRCPRCDSGNFFRARSNVAPRCYECGYVDGRDYQQEAFTASSANTTQATKQVPTSYTPSQIVGRVE